MLFIKINNYPNIRAELVADYYEMGYHLVCIRSYPIEWNPINKQLKLYDISYSLNYTLSNEYETNNSSISQYRANVIRDLIKAKVSNPQDIDKTTILNSSNNNSTVSLISVNEVMENDVINNQKTDYIIVTNKELEPEFKRLANWKTKKGVPTIIKCVEDITNEYHGTDLQEKIHAYLKESKDKWGQGLFVLLGGDTNIIPARFYKSSNDEGGALCPSDAYFSDLDCDWNTNKNNQYGERIYDKLNFKRCNFIGRAAVEDIQEAKIFIDKVLGYEKLNSDMINVSYLNNHLIASAYTCKILGKWAPNGKTLLTDYVNKFDIIKPYFLFDHYNCTCDLHEKILVEKGEELSRNSFLSALNKNANEPLLPFHIVYHKDHSSPRILGASNQLKNQSVSIYDIDNLYNGKYYQIFITGGCEPGHFDKDCIAEHYLNNCQGGAVAVIAHANACYNDERYQYDIFNTSLYQKGLVNIGAIFNEMAGL